MYLAKYIVQSPVKNKGRMIYQGETIILDKLTGKNLEKENIVKFIEDYIEPVTEPEVI